ncbi:NAD-dependent epimerase/dehydratase family protein [Permianibacter aggregans]|uniref:Nucleoside-diphosphate-sugar epimerase n=1 Tax=Permianibacter aggregans TaxID=1510150 RepID=A0A4V6PWT9_9GAMM|nr:NAD-dependent epimerase/dehydratase family protein [Permianibacter aggregans]QGX41340.1 NAD-dependent epimerase/dehydratase family protein [Permianibacter aggregans]TDQ51127.1 nucleoside-diphosphate-sugar epimerase [Permianibacter aggregans]
MVKSVLVTGATGFIGAKVVLALRSKGYSVYIRQPDIEPISPSQKLDRALSDTASILGENKIDAVVHLAAINSSSVNGIDAALLRRVNVDFTKHLAETCVVSGVRRFVQLSTAKVLGEGGSGVYSESSRISPQDDYAQSKADAEIELFNLARHSSMDVVILRPPIVYGPSGGPNFLKLFGLVERGIPLPLGKVGNRRSFIFIDNLVDAIMLSIQHSAGVNQTYMLSDGCVVSTPELIMSIAHELRLRARLFDFPVSVLTFLAKLLRREKLAQSLLNSFEIDDSKIRRELGWIPPYSFEDGLRATATWYRNPLP